MFKALLVNWLYFFFLTVFVPQGARVHITLLFFASFWKEKALNFVLYHKSETFSL